MTRDQSIYVNEYVEAFPILGDKNVAKAIVKNVIEEICSEVDGRLEETTTAYTYMVRCSYPKGTMTALITERGDLFYHEYLLNGEKTHIEDFKKKMNRTVLDLRNINE